MPAELGLDRLLGALAGLEGERRLGELGHHLLAPEEAQVAAVLARRRIDRAFPGQRGEVGAARQRGDDLLRLVLAGDQDVARVDLLLGEALVVLHLVVARAQLVRGRAFLDLLPHEGVPQHAGARLLDLHLDVGILREIGLLRASRQETEVDRPIQQHAVDLRQRHLAILFGQGAGHRLDLAAMHLRTVDDGHDRVFGWSRLLRVSRQAQGEHTEAERGQRHSEHHPELPRSSKGRHKDTTSPPPQASRSARLAGWTGWQVALTQAGVLPI